MDLQGKKINIVGDSITEGVGTSGKGYRYVDILSDMAQFSVLRNYGISGTRIADQRVIEDVTKDYDSFCQRFSKMDDDADIVVVFGGTNDYGHGDALFGNMSDCTPDTYCGAVRFLMRGLIEKYPMSVIAFVTPLQRAGGSIPNDSNQKTLKDYVDVIKAIAEQYAIPVLDLYVSGGICPDIEVQKRALCPDGLHPNDVGHKILARKIKGFLEKI